MLVDCGEWEEKGAVQDTVEVGDAVENCDEVEESCEESDDELCQYAFGDVSTRPFGVGLAELYECYVEAWIQYVLWDLLCQVGNDIWGANGEGTIKHAQAERKSIARIACFILPLAPHESVRSIAKTFRMRQYSTNEDGDEYTGNNQETSDSFNGRKSSVGKHDNDAARPRADKICYEYLPSLGHEVRVE